MEGDIGIESIYLCGNLYLVAVTRLFQQFDMLLNNQACLIPPSHLRIEGFGPMRVPPGPDVKITFVTSVLLEPKRKIR